MIERESLVQHGREKRERGGYFVSNELLFITSMRFVQAILDQHR